MNFRIVKKSILLAVVAVNIGSISLSYGSENHPLHGLIVEHKMRAQILNMPDKSILTIKEGDLYVGKIRTPNGDPIYSVCERVDNTNRGYWVNYADESYNLIAPCSVLCNDAKASDFDPTKKTNQRETLRKNFDLSAEEHNKFIKEKAAKLCTNGIFEQNGIGGGIAGMQLALSPDENNFGDYTDQYIIYAAKYPVVSRKCYNKINKNINETVLEHKIREFKHNYGSIIMSFVATTSPEQSTVTFFGIFRSNLDFINVNGPECPKLANSIQSYGAAVFLDCIMPMNAKIYPMDIKKEWMITLPTINMLENMAQERQTGEMHIGFVGEKDEGIKIKPEMKKKFPAIQRTQGMESDFTHHTDGSSKVLIPLTVLAKSYKENVKK